MKTMAEPTYLFDSPAFDFFIMKKGIEFRFCKKVKGRTKEDLWSVALDGEQLGAVLAEYRRIMDKIGIQ